MFFVTFYVFDVLGVTEESNYLTSLAEKIKPHGDSWQKQSLFHT